MGSMHTAGRSWSATALAIALTAAGCGGSSVVSGTGGVHNDSGVEGRGTGGSSGSGGAGGSNEGTGGIAASGGVAGGLAGGGGPGAAGRGGGGDTASGGRIAAGGGVGTAGGGGSIASGGRAAVDGGNDMAAGTGGAPGDAGTDTAAPAEWLQQFGTGANDEAQAVAMDSSGNVYVVGHVSDASGDLGGKPSGALPGQTIVGSVDAYLRKYSASGVELWTRQFGSIGVDYAFAVAVDGMGNIYVGGWTSGTLPGQTSAGGFDLFVRKYDANAVEQWTRQFGSQGDDHGYSVSVDSIGNLYFVGDVASTLPGQNNTGPIASFVRKYDSSGTEEWTRLIAANADTYAQSVTVGGDGAVYVGGYVNRGTLPGQIMVGLQDAFLKKYNGSGTEQWTRQFGSAIADIGRSVAVDGSGDVYIAGYSFDEAPPSGSLRVEGFLTKYDTNGAEQWTRRSERFGNEFDLSVAVDGGGNVYVGGSSPQDALMTKYDDGGTAIWTRSVGTVSGTDAGLAVGVSSSGKVCIAGSTTSAFPGQTSAGRMDAFVQVFGQ